MLWCFRAECTGRDLNQPGMQELMKKKANHLIFLWLPLLLTAQRAGPEAGDMNLNPFWAVAYRWLNQKARWWFVESVLPRVASERYANLYRYQRTICEALDADPDNPALIYQLVRHNWHMGRGCCVYKYTPLQIERRRVVIEQISWNAN